jgi:hypothetical protein
MDLNPNCVDDLEFRRNFQREKKKLWLKNRRPLREFNFVEQA